MPDYLWAQALSDEEWCEFLAGAVKDGHVPPPLPPDEFQWAWTGSAGIQVMRDAVAFCRLLKSTLAQAGYELGPDSRLLEIGVGWGRIYRALLRETSLIVGIDPVARCIELCRETFPDGKFELVQPQPPYRFADGAFDVIYLYSVFSHLNETEFLTILREAARIVRKGGFILFTTLLPSDETLLPLGFPEAWDAIAEAGRFLFVPTGGGDEVMPASVWGWAHLSQAYLRRILLDFPLRVIAYDPHELIQSFVALRKRQ